MHTYTIEVGRSARTDATLEVRASSKAAAKLMAEAHYRKAHGLDHTAMVFSFTIDVDHVRAA